MGQRIVIVTSTSELNWWHTGTKLQVFKWLDFFEMSWQPPPVTSCVVWNTIPLKIHTDKKACGLRQHLLQVKISFENLIAWSLELGFGVSASHTNLCIFNGIAFQTTQLVRLLAAVCHNDLKNSSHLKTCNLVPVCHRLYSTRISVFSNQDA